MKLITGTLLLGLAAATAWAQNPDLIENTRNTMKALEQKKAIDSNAALAASQSQGTVPAPAAPSAINQPGGSGSATGSSHSMVHHPTQKTSAQVVKTKLAVKPADKKHKKAMAKKRAGKVEVEAQKNPDTKDTKKDTAQVINLTGRRDPFLSPVVNRSMVGSGCSSGKRCLAIDQINLKGIVRADTGMIAVVVNALNKAYFLRENDPVFNGYVVKITGDSIVFKETIQDKLGKPFTREVTKKITTSAV